MSDGIHFKSAPGLTVPDRKPAFAVKLTASKSICSKKYFTINTELIIILFFNPQHMTHVFFTELILPFKGTRHLKAFCPERPA